MSNHSPTPWRQSDDECNILDAVDTVVVGNGGAHYQDAANAALIVRAVNYHARLVESLKRAVWVCESSGYPWTFLPDAKALLAELESEASV